jgi:hypothetical protein
MAAANLERRIDALEREVRSIKLAISESEKTQRPWWERLAGAFKDDELFDEMVKAGRNYRKKAGRRTRPLDEEGAS